MALVGSREGVCRRESCRLLLDGQIEMVPCGQFFSLSVRRRCGSRAWVTWHLGLGLGPPLGPEKRLMPVVEVEAEAGLRCWTFLVILPRQLNCRLRIAIAVFVLFG